MQNVVPKVRERHHTATVSKAAMAVTSEKVYVDLKVHAIPAISYGDLVRENLTAIKKIIVNGSNPVGVVFQVDCLI